MDATLAPRGPSPARSTQPEVDGFAPTAADAAPVETAAAARAFEALPVALVVLDRRGRLVTANAAARVEPDLLAGLGRIGPVLARRAVEAQGPAGITQPRIAGPLWVVAAPLAPADRPADLVVVTAVDPVAPHPAGMQLIADLCGLTPAEAQTAKLVLAGNTPKVIARILRVSLATVKTHLHRVFAKTGTAGQADLARRLARITPPSAPPSETIAPTAAIGVRPTLPAHAPVAAMGRVEIPPV